MNRDELDKRNTAAITHWWVTMRDTGKVAPGLLDDLARIADEHARDVGHAQAEARPAWVPDKADPALAALNEAAGVTEEIRLPLETIPDGLTPEHSVARTRTRTRRNTG